MKLQESPVFNHIHIRPGVYEQDALTGATGFAIECTIAEAEVAR